ncbi:hypothetical protein [Trichlorobacter sp.]|jgi:hypothetical protein|uniref:hypothetical protein n=1 Tax=Trichlorobacter sp. TaxID=2911007 RepID=UPI002A35949F|nr:hypothetical protein [Trichlorobacter sp.]MDY0383116.1 hypothetical protein [Trichlorobacter sp.]
MIIDPPKDDSIHKLLQEVGRTLQENQRFLEALKQDQAVEDEGDAGPDDAAADEEFEEL